MKYGFTGSQKGTDRKTILNVLKNLPLEDKDIVITGACIGIDTQIAHIVAIEYPMVKQLVIVPANRTKISQHLFVLLNDFIFMPEGSNYRDRNERIVAESDKIIAFWTGKKMYSGTYMTINIAKRAEKLIRIIHI